MGLAKGLKTLRTEKRLSLREVEHLRDLEGQKVISYSHLSRIENGDVSPYIETVKQYANEAGFDMHRLSHYAFDLPEPECLGEISPDIKEVIDKILELPSDDRQHLLGKIEGWIEGRNEGGDASEARAGPADRLQQRPSI